MIQIGKYGEPLRKTKGVFEKTDRLVLTDRRMVAVVESALDFSRLYISETT